MTITITRLDFFVITDHGQSPITITEMEISAITVTERSKNANHDHDFKPFGALIIYGCQRAIEDLLQQIRNPSLKTSKNLRKQVRSKTLALGQGVINELYTFSILNYKLGS
ncbi:hypothetical protein V1264_009345 [Littorina saxatilis]|uniref:Uncharacterized protein n=1 Tax=Littorina saxatilis TaxID=31220 RepID=A0AAN9ARB2_9CAEN